MKNTLRFTALALLLTGGAPAISGDTGDKHAGEAMDDGWIHTQVQSELRGLETPDIDIEVRDGVVLLSGFVDSEATRDAAIANASGIQGVTEVCNHLYVADARLMTETTVDDARLEGQVRSSLAQDQRTSAFDINVEVNQGVVLLSGFIDSEQEQEAALELTRNISGVNRVIDGMETLS